MFIMCFVVLVLESWHTGTSALSIGSPVVDEERLRPLGFVFLKFSALTKMCSE